MHQHHQPRAIARLRVLQHLRSHGAPADDEMNALRLTRLVVVQQEAWAPW